MSLELTQPPVLDTIDAKFMSLLKVAKPPKRELFDGSDIALLPLYDELARIAGVKREANWNMVGRSSLVQPGAAQEPVRGWHRDTVNGYMAADELPTEFLIGEDDVVRNFIVERMHRGRPSSEHMTPDLVTDIALAAKFCTAEELQDDYGFGIWSPAPRQVVAVSSTYIHRSTPNPQENAVCRNFALLYESF
ncbi:MAG TPA: hypothetical protein PKA02_03335 [Candidatus Saccharibacteria bacterium]|nr:hypothetical protein [Candidatus Saccharibacteria bacterium]